MAAVQQPEYKVCPIITQLVLSDLTPATNGQRSGTDHRAVWVIRTTVKLRSISRPLGEHFNSRRTAERNEGRRQVFIR